MMYQSPDLWIQMLAVEDVDVFTLSYGESGQDVEIDFGADPSELGGGGN